MWEFVKFGRFLTMKTPCLGQLSRVYLWSGIPIGSSGRLRKLFKEREKMKINMVFYIFVISIALFVWVMPQVVSAELGSDVEQATADARRDAEHNVSLLAWGAAGYVCNVLAPIYAYVALPEVPVGALLGKSPAYVDAYTQVYQQNVSRRRLQAAVIGCAIGSAANSAAYYLFVLPLQENGSK